MVLQSLKQLIFALSTLILCAALSTLILYTLAWYLGILTDIAVSGFETGREII